MYGVMACDECYRTGYGEAEHDTLLWLERPEAALDFYARNTSLRAALWCLARNLRDAAGCALAWRRGREFDWNWEHGDCEEWGPNLDGKPAPGWER